MISARSILHHRQQKRAYMVMPTSAPELIEVGENCNLPPAVCGSFTPDRNPFLYPLDVLDELPQRSILSIVTGIEADPFGAGGHDAPAWWLLHAKPRQEKKVAEELKAQSIAHFLPVTRWKAVTRGRPRHTWAPLFPSYLFLHGTQDVRIQALKTNRLVAIHSVADTLGLRQQLRDLADLIERDVPLRVEERLAVGQQVRVKAGILKDKRGVVVKQGGRTRLFIRILDLLGGVSVEIEQHMVEPYR